MKVKIFSDFGCEIFEEYGKYCIYYDSGESSGSKLKRREISFSDVEKVKKSERDAYEVILSVD